jgi:hypothetical protein
MMTQRPLSQRNEVGLRLLSRTEVAGLNWERIVELVS